ncbi:MAG: antibiotic biosynthesis monooxygenase [Halochromatium sp.]|uniref:antibiotic biosynthesis monooxygenase n=1 Tax=Halochromatium sp. TaxID=2049430 RepID=UPI00397C2817
MSTTLVHIQVMPDTRDAFIAATRENCTQSRLEPGNLRFDLLQAEADPNRFILYEAYVDAEAARAHKETAHYLAWREAVAEMMACPREGVAYRMLEVEP